MSGTETVPVSALNFTAGRYNALVAEMGALRAAATAVLPLVRCDCYDVDAREYGPNYPCPKCHLKNVLGPVPEAPDYDHNANWTPEETT